MRGSVQIAGSCTGRPLGICIRNARSPPLPSVAEPRVASKGRGAGRLSDGWTSERTEERMSRMRVRGRNSGLHVFQRTTPRLENEGQSAVRISRRNEQPALERCLRVNRFAGCNFLPAQEVSVSTVPTVCSSIYISAIQTGFSGRDFVD